MSCCSPLHSSAFHGRGKERSGRGVKGELVKCCMHSLYALWKGGPGMAGMGQVWGFG